MLTTSVDVQPGDDPMHKVGMCAFTADLYTDLSGGFNYPAPFAEMARTTLSYYYTKICKEGIVPAQYLKGTLKTILDCDVKNGKPVDKLLMRVLHNPNREYDGEVWQPVPGFMYVPEYVEA